MIRQAKPTKLVTCSIAKKEKTKNSLLETRNSIQYSISSGRKCWEIDYEDGRGCYMDSNLPWVKRQSMWSDNSECYTEGKVVTSSGHWGRAHKTNTRRSLTETPTLRRNRECSTLISPQVISINIYFKKTANKQIWYLICKDWQKTRCTVGRLATWEWC